MEQTYTINLLDFGSNARSKSELYKLLTRETNLYLPMYKELSIEFITEYLEGRKLVRKWFFSFENNLAIKFSRHQRWQSSWSQTSTNWGQRICVDSWLRNAMHRVICHLSSTVDFQTGSGFQILASKWYSASFS